MKIKKEDVLAAVLKWNQDALENPERGKIPCAGSVEFVTEQVEGLIAYLYQLASSPGNYSFGDAIEALKRGKRVARVGWNGTGMFVFMRPADELHIDMVIDKVKSLPQSVKDYYLQDVLDSEENRMFPAPANEVVEFTPYLCLKDANGRVVNGWLATQTDILSEDWIVLD